MSNILVGYWVIVLGVLLVNSHRYCTLHMVHIHVCIIIYASFIVV